MSAISTLASVVGAFGTLSAAANQRAAADFNARMALQQAERERQIAERDADNYRRKQGALMASARARRAASGVAMTGTPLLADDAMIEEIAMNAETIRRGGQAKAASYQAKAGLERMRGRNAMTTGFVNTGKSLLKEYG